MQSIIFAPSVYAQSTTGDISGLISDQTGAALSGASVIIKNQDTGIEREITANESGIFTARLLPAGKYTLTISIEGFKGVILQDVQVNITQVTSLKLALEPASVSEVVTITATPPLVQSESTQLGRNVDERTLRQLPLPTRNFQQLLTLSPGTSANLSNNTDLGRGDATVSVNGQRTTSNSVRINGVDANSIGTNSTPNIAVPATDTIQEFIVQTSLYDASNGRNAGGNVEAITKSGTNAFHGNAYEFLRNRSLNSNDFFLNAAGQPKPVLTKNQFGFTLGGPIIRDRAFFFGSYQGTRERNGASLNNSLSFPTIPVALTNSNRTAIGLAAAFGLPVSVISPIAVSLLQARLPNGQFVIPTPTTATGLTPISGISKFQEDQFNINLDLKINDKHTFVGKVFSANNPTTQANFNFAGLGNGPTQLPGFGGELDLINRVISLTDTYVFSPNIVNQARFGFNRIRVTSEPQEPFTAKQFGINSPTGNLYSGLPTIQVVGLFTFGSSPFADQSSAINTFNYGDTLSITAGRHRIRLGAEYRRSQVNFFFNAFTRGQLIFPTFASFLAGQSISLLGSGVFDRALRVNEFSFFAQDDIKVNNRLTLNLGVRYEYFGNPTEKQGRLINFLPNQFKAGAPTSIAQPPNGFVQAGNAENPIQGVPLVSDSLIDNDLNNVAPRFGFAFKPFNTDKLVLRGGYGIYFDRVSTRSVNTQVLNFPFFSLATSVGRPLAAPFAPVPQPTAFPVVPTVPSLLGVPISGIFLDPNFRTPYIQQYNFNIQYALTKDLLLEVGYVGSKGTKLLQVISLNQPVFNRATNQFTLPLGPFLSTQKNPAGGIQQVQSSSTSHFDSFQLSLTKQFSKGLQFLASYTLGKSIDNYSGAAINELTGIPGDQFNTSGNRGRSDFDRRNRFVLSGVYDLPKFNVQSKLVGKVVNGWQVSSILTLQSGLPFTIVDAPSNFILQRANVVGGANPEKSGDVKDRLNSFFNTTAFLPSRQALVGTTLNPFFDPNAPFGNLGRNTLTGPGQKNLDISIVKFIPIKESFNMEFRSEFFNAFNTVNFSNPNSNIAVPATFGRITSTSSGPRVIQFALKLSF
ncbi:MAG: TonB-dependent receptor [Acidobacteria bacterium]|nr:TonB-dependent receptor [Acidobacteriota bacterium]